MSRVSKVAVLKTSPQTIVRDYGRLMDLVGADISKVNYHFKTEKSLVILGDQLFRKGALSFLDHDYIWYPTKGKKRIGEFMKTDWGKLFQKYQ